MKIKGLAAGLTFGLVILAMQPAQAVEVKISGQIDRAVLWADNGIDSELFHVDNDNSSTRFRLTGSEQVTDAVKVGVAWETEFESNTSSGVDIDDTDNDDNSASFKERKLEAYFQGPFGKISIGQGDGAANGTSETDLSGTSVVMYSGVNDTAGSVNFRQSDNTIIARIKDTRDNFDGLSRNDRVRYDTPKFGGFYLSSSVTNGDAWEVAARYAGEFDGFGKLAAAVGYIDTNERTGTTDRTQIGGSVSWLSPFGLNLTIAYGSQDPETGNNDPINYYGKLGYKMGMHAIAVEYGMTEDLDQVGDESSNYGVAYVAKPWKGVELFATYRVYMLDRDTVNDIEDINTVMVGTRVKF